MDVDISNTVVVSLNPITPLCPHILVNVRVGECDLLLGLCFNLTLFIDDYCENGWKKTIHLAFIDI